MDAGRRAAFEIIDASLREGAFAHLAAKAELRLLEEQDRAFATELYNGTLDKLVRIDWTLGHFLPKTRVQGRVKNLLRLGAYQILFMDRVPDSAACNTTVQLTKDCGKGALAGFVNGVLRTVAREGKELPLPSEDLNPMLHWSVRASLPLWLTELWVKSYGWDIARAMMAYEPEHGVTSVWANAARGYSPARLKEELSAAGYVLQQGALAKDALQVVRGGNLAAHPLFRAGAFSIQGEASQWIGELIASFQPESVWDACAAPGGKTARIIQGCPATRVLATDVHEHRVNLVSSMALRLGLEGIESRQWDAREPLPGNPRFSVVLLDAPCSGLGTLESNPDIKFHKTMDNLREMAALQAILLQNAADHVLLGGILAYTTCTLNPAENEEQVSAFLQSRKDFELLSWPHLLPKGLDPARLGLGLQLFPHLDKTDGFYIALLKKSGESNA